MQRLTAAFSNQFYQLLVIQGIKHSFIELSRDTVECWLIPVKNSNRIPLSGTDSCHRIFFSSLTLALVSDKMILGITHL